MGNISQQQMGTHQAVGKGSSLTGKGTQANSYVARYIGTSTTVGMAAIGEIQKSNIVCFRNINVTFLNCKLTAFIPHQSIELILQQSKEINQSGISPRYSFDVYVAIDN